MLDLVSAQCTGFGICPRSYASIGIDVGNLGIVGILPPIYISPKSAASASVNIPIYISPMIPIGINSTVADCVVGILRILGIVSVGIGIGISIGISNGIGIGSAVANIGIDSSIIVS